MEPNLFLAEQMQGIGQQVDERFPGILAGRVVQDHSGHFPRALVLLFSGKFVRVHGA
jgi:hypothetical protein